MVLELGLFPVEFDIETGSLYYTDDDVKFLQRAGAVFCKKRQHFYTTSIEVASKCYKYVNNHHLRSEWRRCYDLNCHETNKLETYEELRNLLRKELLKESSQQSRQQQGMVVKGGVLF